MQNPTELEMLLGQVDDYFRSYVSPHHSRLPFPKLHNMDSWLGTPEAKQYGCYVFFSTFGNLLYIGKSDFAVENRIWSWVQKARVQVAGDHWLFEAAFVQIINVQFWWEAPSLEAYLIDKLKPRGNTQGMRAI